jgi:hypothetical protein
VAEEAEDSHTGAAPRQPNRSRRVGPVFLLFRRAD